MEVSTTGPQTTKSSTIEHILVYTNSIVSGLASTGTLKHQKPGEISSNNISLPYLGDFFLLAPTNYMSAYVDTINIHVIQ